MIRARFLKHLVRTLAVLFLAALVLATMTGCPEDEFASKTWTKKLDNPKESERAVTQLAGWNRVAAAIPGGAEAQAGGATVIRGRVPCIEVGCRRQRSRRSANVE